MFFRKDFNERKKDLKEITNINNLLKENEKEINESKKLNEEIIKELKKLFRNNVKFSLHKNKGLLIEKLKSKSYDIILEEINRELSSNLKGINNSIEKFIYSNEQQNEKLNKFEKKIIEELSLNNKKNYKITNKYHNFRLYMSNLLGNENKNFEEELIEELKNSCENSRSILYKKGIINWFNSLFSDFNYLDNIIDILIDTSSKSINSTFNLIKDEANNYFTKYLKNINLLVKSATLEFNDEQKKNGKNYVIHMNKEERNLIRLKKNYLIF